ncbi:site-specific recombinase XerD [Desulfosporosinus acidiphilus SJ4]|uniref:Site-specific recombinase XerD n=1 Tax=Desulfosporosinus acidiphilus (strain DSM 22704 / JCM 16185 / SJ4) TaxID=646529 RepID=I4D6V6_DESAJ|nr:tyrosine-type recombinase/integrase [Desulfosporosinus acidiphilus]AFM41530.1 site-specific recombinase XerD [Desulfosporosinus acidiphilus SJ4]
MSRYKGIYAILIKQYIDLKRNLGYKFKDAESTYYIFDQFTIRNGETEIGITKELADKWAVKRPNESDSTCYKRVMYLIQFSSFLNDSGYPSYIPRLPKAYKSTFTPYIFSKEEMRSVFAASERLKLDNFMDSAVNVIPALLRMLYGTGIRIGEAVSLKVKDVNLTEQYLIIRKSKNGKDRMIPFSDSLANVCRQYRDSLQVVQGPEDYFFVKRNGRRCNPKAIYEWFRKVLWEAGIPHGGKGQGPRLHDIRHVFSVHSLAAMAKAGLDLYYSLPILSEYLGHQSLEATEKYVRLTSEMYPEIISNVNNICAYAFPEVDCHETN